MSDDIDIVARLRVLASEFPTLDGIMDSEWTNAADEIERLRGQIEHHARDRIEYCAAWSKWIEENDGLEIAQWCRAYADAVPYPNPDGPEIVRVIHSRLDARHRMAADEIERLRAERDGKEIDIVQMASICSPVAFKMALRELDGFDTEDKAIRMTAARAVGLAREIVRQSRQEPSR